MITLSLGRHDGIVMSGPSVADDALVIARLRRIAEDAARRNQGSVLIAQAAKNTLAHAVEVLSGDRADDGQQPVWVIQMEGRDRFTCVGCHRPPGAPSPRGLFLQLALDARSYGQSGFGIGDVTADLGRLDAVVTLIAPAPRRNYGSRQQPHGNRSKCHSALVTAGGAERRHG